MLNIFIQEKKEEKKNGYSISSTFNLLGCQDFHGLLFNSLISNILRDTHTHTKLISTIFKKLCIVQKAKNSSGI